MDLMTTEVLDWRTGGLQDQTSKQLRACFNPDPST